MKAGPLSLFAGFIALASCTAFRSAEAATNGAFDSASNYTSDTWTTGSNQGNGFGAWSLFGSTGNSGFSGKYIGSTGGLSGNNFGLYAGPASSNASYDAQRAFAGGALTAGQTFSVDLGHTTVQSGGSVGINFQQVVGTTVTNVFSLIADGKNFYLNDGGSNFGIGTDNANTAYTFSFTYNGGNSYSFTLSGVGSGMNYTATDDISNISQVQFFDFQQGSGENFGFNNLAVVPEPATYLTGAALVFVTAWIGRRRLREAV